MPPARDPAASAWMRRRPARPACGTSRAALAALLAAAAALLGGCASGATRLDRDQVDYARAVALSQKRQTLSNIVALRYADAPSFLSASQIIAGYSLDTSFNGTLSGVISGIVGSSAQLGGVATFSDHPTFTFTPTTGEELAEGYIRPMAPALILPLAQSGVPIDLLLRIAVQSIGRLQNSAALSGANSSGSVEFFELLYVLRRLQIAGALTIRFAKDNAGNHVFMAIDPGDNAQAAVDARKARELLRMSAPEIELVYGAGSEDGHKIGVITRSIQGVLSEIGAQIDVPDPDVSGHTTLPTVRTIGLETRPTIVVHVGDKAPRDAYADIVYRNRHYWIDSGDFDSKFAFSVVQNLILLAEVSQNGKNPVITIPAG